MNVEIVGLERDKNDSDTTLITVKYRLPMTFCSYIMSDGHEDRALRDESEKSYRIRKKAEEEFKKLQLGSDAKLILNNLNGGGSD